MAPPFTPPESEEPAEAPSLFLSRGGRQRLLSASLALLACLGLTYVVPGLQAAQPWARGEDYVPFWNIIGREWLGRGVPPTDGENQIAELAKLAQPDEGTLGEGPRGTGEEASGQETDRDLEDDEVSPRASSGNEQLTKYPAYRGETIDDQEKVTRIEFIAGLDYFYSSLTLTDLGKPKAVTRVGHWGDSVLGDDGVTHAIRRRLQRRFGDAGHGFHVLGRYNIGYMHRGVRFSDQGGWHKCEIIFKCEDDGFYGYGGVSSHSGGGGTSSWATTKEGFGSNVSLFELWYLKQPNGGKFQIKIDGEVQQPVDTTAPEPTSGWQKFEVSDGSHDFEVRAIGGGSSRGFGVLLEREGPGVVWDGLALIGSFTQRLDYQDPTHIAEQIAHRDNDLLVFMLGGNDVQREKMDLYRSMAPYEEEYTRVIQKFRAGKPTASCLIMSLTDHGERVGRTGIRSRRIVPKMVASQRRVAEQQGCAFFNTFEAMGGDGSIARWYHSNPRLAGADFSHPTSAGHEVIAELLVRSLMLGYAEFRDGKAGQALPRRDH